MIEGSCEVLRHVTQRIAVRCEQCQRLQQSLPQQGAYESSSEPSRIHYNRSTKKPADPIAP